MSIILWLLLGAIAGWLAGVLVKGYGFGVLGNIVVGIVGACLGGWLCDVIGIAPGAGVMGSLITAVFGAVVLLVGIGLIRRA
ncbi:MAG: GlsB/YeaQ/YmgE family stress response membrane protein [Planctomycetota bacterium]